MINWFFSLSPIWQALIATCGTWLLTAIGSLPVLFTSRLNRPLFDAILGFAAGVMLAASFWSLLVPAIEFANGTIVPVLIGFTLGGLFLFGLDKSLPHLHSGAAMTNSEGPSVTWQRSTLLISAMTIHNLPEGIAIGVAFGAAASGMEGATIGSAMALAIGIGLQNLPEGLAVAMPLRGEGISRGRCLLAGQASGMVEPIGGILGALTVWYMHALLPYALAFAAAAMIYVVAEELIPESHREGNDDVATLGLLLGFATMMTLDVMLG